MLQAFYRASLWNLSVAEVFTMGPREPHCSGKACPGDLITTTISEHNRHLKPFQQTKWAKIVGIQKPRPHDSPFC